MATSIKPEQDPSAFSDEAWERLNGTPPEEEQQGDNQVVSFWQRLIHGVEGKSRLKEMGRSAVRGAAQFINETEHTAASALKAGLGKIGIGDGEAPEKIVSDEAISQVYGRRSDDPIAAFTESATQFAAGFAATGPLGLSGSFVRVAGSAAVRGAVVDAVAFDPDEAGLAELAARAPEGYGLRELGEALSVNPEDSEAIKRAKRAAAGIVPGVALDALVAGAQRAWAKGAAKLAPPKDLPRIQEIDKKAGEVLAAIADGTHIPEGAHVGVTLNADDTWSLRPTNPQFTISLEPDENLARGLTGDGPRFADRAEAEAQAETINFALNERLQAARNAGGLTTEQAEQLRQSYRALLSGEPIKEGAHFNFSYYSEPDEVLSAIESVSKVFKEELDIAQKAGGVSNEEHIRLVRQFLDGLDPEQMPGLMAEMLERGVTNDVAVSAANVVFRDIALKSSRLFDIVTARPHDAIAWEEARMAASQLVRLQKVLAGTHSDMGRGLKHLQDRDQIAASVPINKKQGPKKHVVPVGNEPKTDIDKIRLREQQRMEIHKIRDPKAKPADLGVEKSQDAGEIAVRPERPAISNADGTPKVFYHGTGTEFDGHDLGRGRSGGEGAFYTDDLSVAESYAKRNSNAVVREARIAPKKLLETSSALSPDEVSDLVSSAKSLGLDLQTAADGFEKNAGRTPTAGELFGNMPNADIVKIVKQSGYDVISFTKGREVQVLDPDAVQTISKNRNSPQLKSDRNKAEFKSSADDKAVPRDIAGMSQAEVLTVLKMAKMSGGAPSKIPSIAGATKIILETSFKRRALEWFINSALSNPLTHITAGTMNMMVSAAEAASRTFAGVIFDNPALRREGIDLLASNLEFLKDNFRTASMAFRQGHSVIKHGEVHQAIPGKLGHIVRTPGRGLLFLDEFTRVMNYRSYVRAKSLRFWRERGLDPALARTPQEAASLRSSLAKAVSNDLKNAFDPNTGTATIPAALKFAEVPTMSADLGQETLGGSIAHLLNTHVEAKFVAPFVKTSVNIFRYTFDRMPVLQFAAKRNREIWREGGEPLQVLMTQTAMATSMFFYGYLEAKAGNITGAGPKEPGLRMLWLEDNKPYSIKIDGEWRSYRRLDPLFTPLSLMADVHDMVQELGDERGADAEDVIAASLAGMAAAFSNKSYMVNMTQFFEAWSGGEGTKMKKWLQGIGTTFTTPQMLRAANDDPYLREVQDFKDAMWAGIPGLSETLPARYNMFGEPILRTHSLSPFPSRGDAERTVATDLLALKKGIEPMARRTFMGVEIDLADGQKFGRVNDLTPYEFMQKELRSPSDGEPSLKQALTELVNSPDYKEASPGSEAYPGGERAIMAFRLIDGYRNRARAEMLEAFPLVQTEVEMLRAAKGAAISEGDAGELEVLREFGRPR